MAYKKVKYIQTQETYIETNLSCGPGTKYVLDMNIVASGTNADNGIIGNTYNWNDTKVFSLMFNSSRANWGYYIAATANDYAGAYNMNRSVVELSTSAFKVYDIVQSAYTVDSTFAEKTLSASPNKILLGNGLSTNRKGTLNFYEVAIYSGDTIVGHFLPYLDTTTNYGVLYDEITDTYLSGNEPSKVVAGPLASAIAVEPNEISAPYSGLSSAITLTIDEVLSWSATTIPSWISLSSTAGTESAEITATIAQNNTYSQRTGTIVFTASNGDTAEIECTQDKHPILVPVNKIYRGGQLVD